MRNVQDDGHARADAGALADQGCEAVTFAAYVPGDALRRWDGHERGSVVGRRSPLSLRPQRLQPVLC